MTAGRVAGTSFFGVMFRGRYQAPHVSDTVRHHPYKAPLRHHYRGIAQKIKACKTPPRVKRRRYTYWVEAFNYTCVDSATLETLSERLVCGSGYTCPDGYSCEDAGRVALNHGVTGYHDIWHAMLQVRVQPQQKTSAASKIFSHLSQMIYRPPTLDHLNLSGRVDCRYVSSTAAHVNAWELHALAHVSWVGYVLCRSCRTSRNSRLRCGCCRSFCVT